LKTTAERNRLILGTAQLGMPYGIGNKSGNPTPEQARSIISTALKNGISHFDTAQDYGESEALLGSVLGELTATREAKITTKLHPTVNILKENDVRFAVERSMKNLKVPTLFCLMLHRENQIEMLDHGTDEILFNLVRSGYTEQIGISVYSPEVAMRAANSEIINIIQLPANILDRRFEKAGVFHAAKANGKKIQLRSIFLQGLLLMNPRDVPEHMSFALPVISQLDKLAQKYSTSRLALALNYVKEKYPDSGIIFGAESLKQVSEVCSIWNTEDRINFIQDADDIFRNVSERILNPAQWH